MVLVGCWLVVVGGGVCVCSWYGVVCARGAVVVVVVGGFRDALVVNTSAWENMMVVLLVTINRDSWVDSCFIVSGETLGCVQRRTAVKSSVTGALRVATFSTQETSPR